MRKNRDSCKALPGGDTGMGGKKERQSNMELLRLIAMLFVLMLHANYKSIGCPVQADFADNPCSAFLRVAFEHLSGVGVDVFVLISGWFGIRPGWRGAAGLMFQVACLSVLVSAAFVIMGEPVQAGKFLKAATGSNYWFFVAYIGLYILSPLLNAFVTHASRRQMELFLVSFFAFEMFYGFVAGGEMLGDGFATFSFIGLYILARYVRLMPCCVKTWNSRRLLSLYLLIIAMSVGLFIFILLVYDYKGWFVSYISPFIILGSLFLLLAFSRVRLHSRVVNWLAGSCFSIYLIHCHPLVFPCYTYFFAGLYSRFSGAVYLLVALLCLLGIGLGCILIDRLRIFLWSRLLPLLERNVVPRLRSLCSCVRRQRRP